MGPDHPRPLHARARARFVPILSVTIAAALALGIIGQIHAVTGTPELRSGAARSSGVRQNPQSVFVAEIDHPVGLAATSSELLATTYASTTIDSIVGDGGYTTFSTVPDLDPNCTVMSISISPGFGGFQKNYVFVAQGPWIFSINPTGRSVKLFTSLDSESGGSPVPTGLTFDTVGSFGYQLIATAQPGDVYTISSSGQTQLLTSVNASALVGPTVAPLSFGAVGGDLLVSTSGAPGNNVLAITPDGSVDYLAYWPGATSVTTAPAHPCDWEGTSASYFLALNTSDEIVGLASSSLIAGQGYVTSAIGIEAPVGVGSFTSAGGEAQAFYNTSDEIWSSAWANCPVFGQVVQISNGNWYPYEMAYDPVDRDMYVTDNESDQVFFFDPESEIIGQATVGTDPTGVAYDAANSEMLVSNSLSDNVSIFNASTNEVTGSIPVGTDPQGIAYDPADADAYVADNGSNNLTVIDAANQTVASVPTGPEPFGVAYDEANGYIYVADLGGSITVVDGERVVSTIPVDGAATGLAQNALSNGRMFATIYGSSQVARLSPHQVLAYLPVGADPFAIALDPRLGDLVVVNHANGTLTILHGPSTVLGTVQFGEPGGPWGIAYDPANGLIYVAGELVGDPRTIGGGEG